MTHLLLLSLFAMIALRAVVLALMWLPATATLPALHLPAPDQRGAFTVLILAEAAGFLALMKWSTNGSLWPLSILAALCGIAVFQGIFTALHDGIGVLQIDVPLAAVALLATATLIYRELPA